MVRGFVSILARKEGRRWRRPRPAPGTRSLGSMFAVVTCTRRDAVREVDHRDSRSGPHRTPPRFSLRVQIVQAKTVLPIDMPSEESCFIFNGIIALEEPQQRIVVEIVAGPFYNWTLKHAPTLTSRGDLLLLGRWSSHKLLKINHKYECDRITWAQGVGSSNLPAPTNVNNSFICNVGFVRR